ncbi:MAG: chalcone isomerase family protein [Rubripirellula sp.]
MSKLTQRIAAVLLFLLATGVVHNAAAADFPSQLKTGEHSLVLNGWGARTKYLLELYVAGLYLSEASSDPVAIAGADLPMSIRIKITSRFVSQEKLVDSLTDGFRNSTNGNLAGIQSQINQFRKCFHEAISQGDTFDIVYLPKSGVIVNKNGKFKGVIAGIEFKKALFNIWLSDNPADETLKQAMLVQKSRR